MSTTHNSGPEAPSKSEREHIGGLFAEQSRELHCLQFRSTGQMVFIVRNGPKYRVFTDWDDVVGLLVNVLAGEL